MSIYATLWTVKSRLSGDDLTGGDWVGAMARGSTLAAA